MTGGASLAANQAVLLVEPERRCRNAGTLSELSDRESLDFNHC